MISQPFGIFVSLKAHTWQVDSKCKDDRSLVCPTFNQPLWFDIRCMVHQGFIPGVDLQKPTWLVPKPVLRFQRGHSEVPVMGYDGNEASWNSLLRASNHQVVDVWSSFMDRCVVFVDSYVGNSKCFIHVYGCCWKLMKFWHLAFVAIIWAMSRVLMTTWKRQNCAALPTLIASGQLKFLVFHNYK